MSAHVVSDFKIGDKIQYYERLTKDFETGFVSQVKDDKVVVDTIFGEYKFKPEEIEFVDIPF